MEPRWLPPKSQTPTICFLVAPLYRIDACMRFLSDTACNMVAKHCSSIALHKQDFLIPGHQYDDKSGSRHRGENNPEEQSV